MALSLFASNAVLVSIPAHVGFVESIVEDGHLAERTQLAGDHVAGHAGGRRGGPVARRRREIQMTPRATNRCRPT